MSYPSVVTVKPFSCVYNHHHHRSDTWLRVYLESAHIAQVWQTSQSWCYYTFDDYTDYTDDVITFLIKHFPWDTRDDEDNED